LALGRIQKSCAPIPVLRQQLCEIDKRGFDCLLLQILYPVFRLLSTSIAEQITGGLIKKLLHRHVRFHIRIFALASHCLARF
jgi:hypothetical protein